MSLLGEKETVTLDVKGMTCGHCVATVEGALKGAPGVRKAMVDLDRGFAEVTYDPGQAKPEDLAAIVREAGYEATPRANAA